MPIPFIDIKAQHREIEKELKKAIFSAFNRGDYILGEDVRKFESEFAKFCNTRFAVGVNSGTDALFLSLLSQGIGKGDEVIVPVFTFIATAFAVTYTGAKPVFVDIDESTYNIDPDKIKQVVNKRTRAIIPVHLFGQPADLGSIMEISSELNLKVIEDAAQAHGAEYKGKKAGEFGITGCFSFYPTKNLGGLGDGGMVVTNSEKAYRALHLLRDCGRKQRYKHIIKGYNSRLDNLQAAVLRVKLKKLEKWNSLRRKNAFLYTELLKGLPGITTPYKNKNCTHVFHQYAIRTANRDRILEVLKNKGIAAGVYYPLPLHLQPAYKDLGYQRGDFPVAEKIAQDILSLPMYPGLKRKQILKIAEVLKKAL